MQLGLHSSQGDLLRPEVQGYQAEAPKPFQDIQVMRSSYLNDEIVIPRAGGFLGEEPLETVQVLHGRRGDRDGPGRWRRAGAEILQYVQLSLFCGSL